MEDGGSISRGANLGLIPSPVQHLGIPSLISILFILFPIAPLNPQFANFSWTPVFLEKDVSGDMSYQLTASVSLMFKASAWPEP